MDNILLSRQFIITVDETVHIYFKILFQYFTSSRPETFKKSIIGWYSTDKANSKL